MTPRTQRRAAERKSHKAEQKKLRNLAAAAALKATLHTPPSEPEPIELQTVELQTAKPATTISEAQLTANRANAKQSTGPITDLGKSISSRNNLRHGLTQSEGDPILLDSESPEEYAHFLAGYRAEWQPATPTECDLVNRLVTHTWLRRRALGLQKLFLDPATGLVTDFKQHTLYQRYEVQHERALNKALADLMRLRSLRIREQNGFESQRRKNEKHEFQIRHLQHREKLHHLAQLTAEARLTVAENKLQKAKQTNSQPPSPSAPSQEL